MKSIAMTRWLGAVLCGLALVAVAAGDQPVEVTLYGESLCPFCKNWILTQAQSLFDEGFSSHIQFRYVAWGNARLNKDDKPACQHGPAECEGNRLINCAQATASGGQDAWFPYIACLAHSSGRNWEADGRACANAAGLDAGTIEACAHGELGDELEQAARRETATLRPQHSGVPWVLVNGVPLRDADDQMLLIVCAAIPAHTPKPDACFPGADDRVEVDQMALHSTLPDPDDGAWMSLAWLKEELRQFLRNIGDDGVSLRRHIW